MVASQSRTLPDNKVVCDAFPLVEEMCLLWDVLGSFPSSELERLLISRSYRIQDNDALKELCGKYLIHQIKTIMMQ